MNKHGPNEPIDAIIFDCDGTLSQIEGVDELARMRGVEWEVGALTADAMSLGSLSPDIYQRRLNLIEPSSTDMSRLAEAYYETRTQGIEQVLRVFERLQKPVFVISAGMRPAVSAFAQRLGIRDDQVYAVDMRFDEDGHYEDFDRHSLLTSNEGKHFILEQLIIDHPRLIHIGDGMNDLSAAKLAERFIGYGGVFYREQIANLCEYYIKSDSMLPLLPLVLTNEEVTQIPEADQADYLAGLAMLQDGAVEFRQMDDS